MKGLKESSECYDLISEGGIYPISSVDAKIIKSLIEILKDMDVNSKLIKVIKGWKNMPDEDLIQELSQLSDDLEQNPDKNKSAKIDFVRVNGSSLKVQTLFSFETIDDYNYERVRPEYKIIVNKTDNTSLINGNKELTYCNPIDRDLDLQDLEDKLKEFTNIRFL